MEIEHRDFSQEFSKFHKANEGKYFFTAHSHHFWPDCTLQGQIDYWNDSASLVDNKWNKVFSEILPEVCNGICEILSIQGMENRIAIASNTHEFILRLLSCFPQSKKIKILTTDSEFYSFERQIQRLEEDQLVEVTRVPTLPLIDFEERFQRAIKNSSGDLLFFSQVFFNSGYAIKDFESLIRLGEKNFNKIVMDGYHGYMAIPTNLSEVIDKCFYLTGSYKYAMSGEGLCFLTIPKKYSGTEILRPLNTGWFADFGSLENLGKKLSYADNGFGLMGATMDCSSLYRARSVFRWLKERKISVEEIHEYIQFLQNSFLNYLDDSGHKIFHRENLLLIDQTHHGHFLTFKFPSPEITSFLIKELQHLGVYVDGRKDRLRFGFGIYQKSPLELPEGFESISH